MGRESYFICSEVLDLLSNKKGGKKCAAECAIPTKRSRLVSIHVFCLYSKILWIFVSSKCCGCVLVHYQCGLGPFKCCDYDNNAMCWGCICCAYQIDPCWIPRNLTHCCCECVPCGCISKEIIFTICCCNPGRATMDPYEKQKEINAAAAAQNANSQ